MTAAFPRVALREAAQPVARIINPLVGEMYRQLGVRLWGQGAYEREPVDGGLTKYQQLFRAEQGDIVVNKIWARNGSVAVVDAGLAGCYGSNEFPMFAPVPGRLEPQWMHWLTKTRDFWAQCDQKSQGTSGQNRIKPELFLQIEIPLPPLKEQRRIVAQIEKLVAKVEEAQAYRAQATEQREGFIESFIGQHFAELEAIHPARTFGSYDAHVSSGPRNWGKNYASSGLRFYRAQDISRDFQISDESIVYVERPPGSQGQSAMVSNGDLLIVITGATVGRVAVYDDTYSPGLVSQHVAVCRIPPASFLPKFALWGLRGPNGQKQLLGSRYGQGKPGLNLDQIRRLSLPRPPIDVQVKIIAELEALQSKLDSVKALQAETTTELDAMLPAILDKAFKGEL